MAEKYFLLHHLTGAPIHQTHRTHNTKEEGAGEGNNVYSIIIHVLKKMYSHLCRLKVEKNENAEYEKPFKMCRERKTTKRAVLEIVAVLLSQCLQ